MAEPAAAPTKTGLKRRRIAVGSSEQYDETTSRLGAGGFGSVVRARYRATDRPVAIKRLGAVRVPGTMDLRLVMECVGPSLHDVLRHKGPPGSPPLPEATPKNILVVDGHRVVKVCDFGLAMSTDEPPPYDPVGTLYYKAPELLLEKQDYNAKIDVWALGCVMAGLINGGEPSRASTT
ncbi:hypothetical protein BAE44_0002011 [Dichanthelium oligosanthes]|uniref:[RNA-polymerase]-subunit kinase n=1 Tax=Dichanthelium oligosanthes TaxID=888268 RepID=A0A1E5WHW7_9POAL|nr:hypothetical protein BAE44_0002011 [Dichanthelium oligosanthes]